MRESRRCDRCEALAAATSDRLERGLLPRIEPHDIRPILTMVTAIARCCVCDLEIFGHHWLYPKFENPNTNVRADLHFHDLCNEIWTEFVL